MSSALKHYDVKTFVSSRSVGYLLKMAQSLMMQAASTAFIGHELSFMQWLVLVKVHEGVARMPSDLGRQIHHDNGALTRMLDQLEARGFIERHRSATDRRVVELKLTAAGVRKVEELKPVAVNKLNVPLAEFSKAEFAEFIRLLHKLIDGLRHCTSQDTEAGELWSGRTAGATQGNARAAAAVTSRGATGGRVATPSRTAARRLGGRKIAGRGRGRRTT